MFRVVRSFTDIGKKIKDFRFGVFTPVELRDELSNFKRLMKETKFSGFQISNFLLGINAKINRPSDNPEIFHLIYKQLNENMLEYDGRSLATIAWVLRRKRIQDNLLMRDLLTQLSSKLDDLEQSHIIMAFETISYKTQTTSTELVDGMYNKVLSLEGKLTAKNLTQFAGNLNRLHNKLKPKLVIYDFIESEALRMGSELDIRSFATILYSCSRFHKLRPSNLAVKTYPYVWRQLGSVNDSTTYPILLNTYSNSMNFAFFIDIYEYVANKILKNPDYYLSTIPSLVSFSHSYSKTGFSDEVMKLIIKRTKRLPKALIDASKPLGVFLYSLFRRPVDADFVSGPVTDWLMTYKDGLMNHHLKKIIRCKLQHSPNDIDFWKRLGVLKKIQFSECDAKLLRDYQFILESCGVDTSRLRIVDRQESEEETDDELIQLLEKQRAYL